MKQYKHWPYLVSDSGKVVNMRTSKELKPNLAGRKGSEYMQVKLCNYGDCKSIYIHQLVAELYVLKPRANEDYQVTFIDGDRFNTSSGNLKWSTQEELLNTAKNSLKNRAAWHCVQASKKGFGYIFPKIRDAERFGFDSSSICHVISGKLSNCKGYSFESLANLRAVPA